MPNASLLSPFDLRGLSLSSRVVLAPLTRNRATAERVPTPMMATYYAQRASAGLIITEATVVAADAVGQMFTPGIYNDAQVEAWRSVVAAAHAKGGRIFCQLWHCGRASHSSLLNGELPVSASAIRLGNDHIHTPSGKQPYETPRALRTDELPGIVARFAAAAANARAAGFDGVEIHGANGYLLDQFLQSATNQRTDAYGGSVENRFRLLREVVEAVARVWPAARVGVRLSPNGPFNGMGSPDFRAQFAYAARELDGYGLAYLHVLDGLAFGFHNLGEPMTLADFRAVFRGPLMANCGYTRETAEAAITSGAADLVAFGRPYISNPDLVERFAAGAALNPDAAQSTWYAGGEKGYIDYPVMAR